VVRNFASSTDFNTIFYTTYWLLRRTVTFAVSVVFFLWTSAFRIQLRKHKNAIRLGLNCTQLIRVQVIRR